MKLQHSDKLVMIGDSITDCGRQHPVGEQFGGLGNGYVSVVDAALQSVRPDLGIRVVNMGISGNTVRDLKERWHRDVLDQKPDWLSIMIGINDVWRQFDRPYQREAHVYIDEYERTLRELVGMTRDKVKGLVLMTPYYMESNREDPMRATMDEYGQVVKTIASENNALFVDTQKAMDKVISHLYPASLGWDRVHPNLIGHMTLARAFLDAIGFEW